MKVVEINSVPFGSTGTIARNITNLVNQKGKGYFFYSWTKKRKSNTLKDEFLISSFIEKFISLNLERITGNIGYFSLFGTKKLLKQLDSIKPDIVHLHNLHEGYLNYKMLFQYLKKNNIKIVWTLHDCWAFTGHCPHFEMVNCNKWKDICDNCPIYKKYPKSLFDNSKKSYIYKKSCFTSIDKNNLIIVTPSNWLAEKTKESFLNKYEIKVINNGINLSVFKPSKNTFRNNYNLENKYIILGVAMDWSDKKGLDVFVRLSNELPNDYQIVLVGTNEKIDKILPDNIISIHKTYNQKELAEIYSTANVFVNPTREENFPTVNIEALACGTPVITYKTGGSPEIISNKCGIIVDKDNYEELKMNIIKKISNSFDENDCINRAKMFNYKEKFIEYIDLFEQFISK